MNISSQSRHTGPIFYANPVKALLREPELGRFAGAWAATEGKESVVVALFFPRIAVHVVAISLPKAGAVTFYEFEA